MNRVVGVTGLGTLAPVTGRVVVGDGWVLPKRVVVVATVGVTTGAVLPVVEGRASRAVARTSSRFGCWGR